MKLSSRLLSELKARKKATHTAYTSLGNATDQAKKLDNRANEEADLAIYWLDLEDVEQADIHMAKSQAASKEARRLRFEQLKQDQEDADAAAVAWIQKYKGCRKVVLS